MKDMKINAEKSSGFGLSPEMLEDLRAELGGVAKGATEALGVFALPAVLASGAIGEFGGRLLSTGRGKATLALLTLSMGIGACAAAVPSSENPTGIPPIPPVETAAVNPTATYAVENSEASGLALDVESILTIDPYDEAHARIKANLIADFVKESLGSEISKDVSFWEVYGKSGGAAGMLAHFTYGDSQWIMASYGADGLGYLGTDSDPIVAMQLVKNQAGFVSVVTPDGLRQIFQTDIFSDEVIAFLPFGEADWVERQNSPIGKFQAAPTEVPDGLIELLKNGGHYDFDQNGYVDSVGGLVYVVGKDGEIGLAVVMPAELSNFKQTGGEVDMDKGIAWNPENGRVMWLRARDGSWTEMKNGEALFNLTNGETLTLPIFDDIESAIEYAVNVEGMAWGDLSAFRQDAQTAADKEFYRKAILTIYMRSASDRVGGDVRLSQSDAPQKIAETKLGEYGLDDGNLLTLFTWRSSSDGNLNTVLIVGDTQEILDALNSGSVHVPSPK